ncbi:MAG TPA: membrane protein insertase YidC [Longimicrobiaceae bacterium]
MEKRLLLAVLLISAVMVITNLLFPPPPPVEESAGEPTDSVAAVSTPAAPAVAAPVITAPEDTVAADTVVVTSGLYRYAFSTRGASLVRAELPEYPSYTRPGESVQLAPEDADEFLSLRLVVGSDTIDLSRVVFTPNLASITLAEGGEPQTLRFSYADPSGFGVNLSYTFQPDRYLIRVRGEVIGLAGRPATLVTAMGPGLAPHEARDHHSERELAVVLRSDGDVERLRMANLQGSVPLPGPMTWVGLKDKYFVVAQIAGDEHPFTQGTATRLRDVSHFFVEGEDTIAASLPRAEVIAALPVSADGVVEYDLYAGPQDFQQLAAAGYELEDVTQYAYAWLEPVIRPFAALILIILDFLHDTLDLAYGWVLVIFGVFLRILLWPLNAKAFRAQLKNMAVTPLMQEIREKYKDDPQKQQEALMRLYKEHGFNPLAGCLPMLLPWPVLITLFFVFQNTIAFRGAGFLWLPDLSLRDPLYVLPLFLVASMFAMQWVTTQMSGVEQNPQMKMMMYVLPIMMGIFFYSMPAGLNLYYATTNVAGLPQQLMIARERRRAQEEMKAQKGSPRPAPMPSGSKGRKKRQARG